MPKYLIMSWERTLSSDNELYWNARFAFNKQVLNLKRNNLDDRIPIFEYLDHLGFSLVTCTVHEEYIFQFIADDIDDIMRVTEDLKDLVNDPSVLESE